MHRSIYLDYHSTTPVDPQVVQAMEPFFSEKFGNSSSQSHSYGWQAQMALEKARAQVANYIGANPQDVIFTSGATESNNLALQGLLLPQLMAGKKPHLITSAVEHKSVLRVAKRLESWGAELSVVPPDRFGEVKLNILLEALRPTTQLISIVWGNNEIGTINDVETIAHALSQRGVLFHTDGTQAVPYLACNMENSAISMMSFSGHKLYGPKGVGALFIKNRKQTMLEPLLLGGEHEFGLRAGTVNVPGAVGLGMACEILRAKREAWVEHLESLRNALQSHLLARFPHFVVNGLPSRRLPNNLSLTVRGVNKDNLAGIFTRLAVSAGSACSSGSTDSSHVLTAIGLSTEDAGSTLRISLGRSTTSADIEEAAQAILEVVNTQQS